MSLYTLCFIRTVHNGIRFISNRKGCVSAPNKVCTIINSDNNEHFGIQMLIEFSIFNVLFPLCSVCTYIVQPLMFGTIRKRRKDNIVKMIFGKKSTFR